LRANGVYERLVETLGDLRRSGVYETRTASAAAIAQRLFI
jgi:hypothetical protein